MNSFRNQKPCRTCKKTYAKYNQYKTYLRSDFNKKCGYCDDLDLINGGKRSYQIDHFVPMKPIEITVTIEENDYSNLVYSCPFCNRAKSNKWFTDHETKHHDGNKGFLDPCSDDYDKLFKRNHLGEIEPQTPLGQHIYNELDFYLARHRIIWNIQRIDTNIKKLSAALEKVEDPDQKQQLKELLMEFYKLSKDLEIEND